MVETKGCSNGGKVTMLIREQLARSSDRRPLMELQ